ncbi:uncharacterized protein LOC134779294 [Penaeus indicus]|uniref:uncharacterized protein LOC134779294 n=2 Tax=Penaeus indicus TaxID=29960 RepID=UPI00300C05AD
MGLQGDLNALKKQRGTAKGKFTRKVTLCKEGIDRGDDLLVLKTNYEEVIEAFKCLECKNDELIQFISDNEDKLEDKNLEEEAEQYILDSERLKNELCAKIFMANNEKKATDKPKVKVKRFEPPKFEGNLREYPTFKEDYKNLVQSEYGADPYALKMCLGGEALQAVKGSEGNYDEMFKRLDDKFGNPRKIVDLVISDLKSLRKISDGDTKGFIKMVDQVEQCWLDLKRVNLSDELNTANVVSHIEKILPSLQKREWVIKASDISVTGELFSELLGFLQKERKVLEYMNSNVRTSTSDSRATVHHVENVVENNSESELVKLMRKLNEEQQSKNREFESCIVNLNEMIKGIKCKENNISIGCLLHNSESHDITNCLKFKGCNSKERFDVIKRNGICFRCLKGYHSARGCKVGKLCDAVIEGQGPCNRNHHPLLHQDRIESNSHNAVMEKKGKALLNISTVHSKNLPVTVLWDPGSDTSLITYRMAKKLGLSGKDVNLSLIKVGNTTEHQSSKAYCVPLTDKNGKVWNVDAVGMNEISSKVKRIDLSRLPELFIRISNLEVDLPCGEIDMLIGTDCCEILPRVVEQNEGIQLLENQFGFSIRGRHDKITNGSNTSNHTLVRTHKLSSLVDLKEISVESTDTLKTKLDKFFAMEEMGTKCKPQCIKCMCRGCPEPNCTSLKEERELALIEEGLLYNEEQKCWRAKYPWLRDPMHLKDNIKVANARLKTTENRLKKLGNEYAMKYQREIEDMINRGVARKLTKEEIREYKGPVHYIHHHEVLKPESKSTPIRIVFNSSASYMGQKLNDFWAKGPDILNSLLGVLFRFRQNNIAIAGDIAKMYHTVKLSTMDEHTHRFLWRDLDDNRPPDQYALTTVTFGDKPSGTIATLALRHTVEKFGKEHPDVQDMIINNTYVDDILYSTDTVENAFKVIQDTEKILSQGSFRVKHWIVSGHYESCKVNVIKSDQEKILGLKWNPLEDHFFFTVKLNFSSRIRNVRSGPKLNLDEIDDKFPEHLTRRMILSQIASIYDPLGFAVPVLLKAKILMRLLISKGESKDGGIKWDDPLDISTVREWKMFFKELYELEKLTFRRSLIPSNAVGKPSLIIFSDSSMQAYGACAYVRWQTGEDEFESHLIAARNKIAPMKQMSIPRLELCAALMAARLRESILKEFTWKFEAIYHIVDSSIVRSQIQKESHGFNTFVAVRIAEIQIKTDPKEWWWVDSTQNIADMTSRPCKPEKIGRESDWQNGPKFLTLPTSRWPIRQTCEDELTDRIGISMTVNNASHENCGMQLIDVNRYSDYYKLLRVTCRVMNVFKYKSFKGILRSPTVQGITDAEILWVKEMQKSMTDWETRFKRLGPSVEKGIIVVGQRISKWLKDNWNQENFMLIPNKHPVTRLYISCLHKVDHAGIETTLCKLQRKFWVPGARKLIRTIKNKCVTCRKLNKKVEDQCMGQVRAERMKPAPPFYHTAVDLFGPLTIRDSVKKRTHGKAFGIIFNCLVTRAVYLDLAMGYSTDDFLTTFQRFIAIRGAPKFMYSDRGTQLISASKKIESIGEKEGVTWIFNMPSDAPWYNGVSEALIKSVKRSICVSIGDSILTFGELQTALFCIANLMNERPIGLKPGFSLELGSYLCPNDLLLGRSSCHCPIGLYEIDGDHKRRLRFIQDIINSFWKKWQRDYFPSMLIRQKWHTAKRNVKVGDVVLVQDSNIVRGTWKLAQVIRADPGRDGIVREVDLRYKIIKDGKGYYGEADKIMCRSVHRLVMLLPIEEQV